MSGPVNVRRSRNGRRPHTRRRPHLYRGRGTEAREMELFEERYGKRRGDYVYGATVGKVRRERAARRGR